MKTMEVVLCFFWKAISLPSETDDQGGKGKFVLIIGAAQQLIIRHFRRQENMISIICLVIGIAVSFSPHDFHSA